MQQTQQHPGKMVSDRVWKSEDVASMLVVFWPLSDSASSLFFLYYLNGMALGWIFCCVGFCLFVCLNLLKNILFLQWLQKSMSTPVLNIHILTVQIMGNLLWVALIEQVG